MIKSVWQHIQRAAGLFIKVLCSCLLCCRSANTSFILPHLLGVAFPLTLPNTPQPFPPTIPSASLRLLFHNKHTKHHPKIVGAQT